MPLTCSTKYKLLINPTFLLNPQTHINIFKQGEASIEMTRLVRWRTCG